METTGLYILTAYEEGSFLKAAEKLYISQPALSIAVRKAEEKIGESIFEKGKRPLTLTVVGAAYIDMLRGMQQLEDSFEQRLGDLQNLETGSLTLGGTYFSNIYIFPKIAREFARKHPKVSLTLLEDTVPQLEEMLLNGRLDVMITAQPVDKELLNHIPIFYDHILFAMTPQVPLFSKISDYKLTHQDVCENRHLQPNCPILPGNIFDNEPLIKITPKKGTLLTEENNWTIFSQGQSIMQVEQLLTSYYFAKEGLGICAVSEVVVKNTLPSDLYFFKVDTNPARRKFYALTAKKRYTTNAIKEFINIVRGMSGGI